MGSSTEICIALDNPARSYFAGESVTGHVIIQTDYPIDVKEVTISLDGNGRVHRLDTEYYTRTHYPLESSMEPFFDISLGPRRETVVHDRTVVFSGKETYITEKVALVSGLTKIPIGKSIYPFQFTLPSTLPSSFVTKIGTVAYHLQAEIRRPIEKQNKTTSLPFTVNGILDLNQIPGGDQSQTQRKVKGGNILACRRGQVSYVLTLNQSGFVPGEHVQFSCDIHNGSSSKVKSVTVCIFQVVTFYAQDQSKCETKSVCEIRGPSVSSGEEEMWMPTGFVIPPVPPTKLGGSTSQIIDVQYALQLDMAIQGATKPLSARLPILVGTIPLRRNKDLLCPSYAEAVATRVHGFVPNYVTYYYKR